MPYFNLGLALQATGTPSEAAGAYRRFLELASGQPGTASSIERARQRLAELERGPDSTPPPAIGR